MAERTLNQIATEVWETLKALLEIYPYIYDELGSEAGRLSAASGNGDNWAREMEFALFLVQHYPSMTAAAKPNKLTHIALQRKLKRIQMGICTQPFAKWVMERPILLAKIVKMFGLKGWPYLCNRIGFLEDVREERYEAIFPLVIHPDVAELFAGRFAGLREEIVGEQKNAALYQRRLKLIKYLLDVTDPERIEQLENAAWPKRKVVPKQYFISGDVKKVPIEEFDFSVRAYNCLKKANIQTVGDLTEASEEELMNIRNFGRKNLVEIRDMLAQLGLTIKGEEPTSVATEAAAAN